MPDVDRPYFRLLAFELERVALKGEAELEAVVKELEHRSTRAAREVRNNLGQRIRNGNGARHDNHGNNININHGIANHETARELDLLRRAQDILKQNHSEAVDNLAAATERHERMIREQTAQREQDVLESRAREEKLQHELNLRQAKLQQELNAREAKLKEELNEVRRQAQQPVYIQTRVIVPPPPVVDPLDEPQVIHVPYYSRPRPDDNLDITTQVVTVFMIGLGFIGVAALLIVLLLAVFK